MARRDARDEITAYNEAKTIRSRRENNWRLASAYCLPQHYGGWQTDGPTNYMNASEAPKRIAFDTSGMRSLPKYMSVLERLATPAGMKYQGLAPTNTYLMKSMRVRAYFDELTTLLFKLREGAKAQFRQASNEVYTGMGAYGTGPIYIGERARTPVYNEPSLIYKACPLRDIFILTDDNGEVVKVFRRFWLNYRQYKTKFPNYPVPPSMAAQVNAPKETDFFEFVHIVCVRELADYDPKSIEVNRHPISGSYISVKDAAYTGDEHGYRTLPYLTPRTFTIAGDPYGFSPAELALPALGGASAVKKTYLKQGNKAVDPVLLAFDDGVMNGEVDLRPGAINYGGVDKQGRELIKALQVGNFVVAEKLLEREIADVEDCFFVTLFQILQETPEMTATEVIERVAEKTALLSPTMGRVQSEFLGPCTEREISLIGEMGILPEMPPELEEAQGEYKVTYTSPMAKGVYAEETAGFMRTVELALNFATASGDPGPLDHFDMDTAIPEIADHQGTPTRWLRTLDKVEEIRSQRADQQQEQQLLTNASGVAQLAKVANAAPNEGKKRRL